MGFVPLFRDEVIDEVVALAAKADGGAILISPAGDLALARGKVTSEAAHTSRTSAPRAVPWTGDVASFTCDDGTWVHAVPICNGWVLAVQTFVAPEVRQPFNAAAALDLHQALRSARNNLILWLGYRQQVPAGNAPAGGSGGAPAHVFVEPPSRRKN